jgi:hypothetical protein
MSKVQLQGNVSGTGVFTIASPNSNTDRTLTLPDNTGTILTSASSVTQNSGPAFSGKSNVIQTISSGSFTQVAFQLEEFDTNNNFSSNTFTPNVAGYYQFTFNVIGRGAVTLSRFIVSVYKNGATTGRQWDCDVDSGAAWFVNGSRLLYCNGTTDAITLYVYMEGSGTLSIGSTDDNTNYFSGVLVRAA